MNRLQEEILEELDREYEFDQDRAIAIYELCKEAFTADFRDEIRDAAMVEIRAEMMGTSKTPAPTKLTPEAVKSYFMGEKNGVNQCSDDEALSRTLNWFAHYKVFEVNIFDALRRVWEVTIKCSKCKTTQVFETTYSNAGDLAVELIIDRNCCGWL